MEGAQFLSGLGPRRDNTKIVLETLERGPKKPTSNPVANPLCGVHGDVPTAILPLLGRQGRSQWPPEAPLCTSRHGDGLGVEYVQLPSVPETQSPSKNCSPDMGGPPRPLEK